MNPSGCENKPRHFRGSAIYNVLTLKRALACWTRSVLGQPELGFGCTPVKNGGDDDVDLIMMVGVMATIASQLSPV